MPMPSLPNLYPPKRKSQAGRPRRDGHKRAFSPVEAAMWPKLKYDLRRLTREQWKAKLAEWRADRTQKGRR